MADDNLDQLPRTRKEAIDQGEKRYFTGKPCKSGHIVPRFLTGTCSECAKISVKKWTSANKDRMRDYAAEWHAKNRSRRIVAHRAWNNSNKDYLKERSRIWRSKNPEKMSAYAHNYRARKFASEGSHTGGDITEIRRSQKDKCGYCGIRLKGRGHIDHIVALASGGANHRKNLQLLCETCNKRKSDRDPIEYARSIGKLI